MTYDVYAVFPEAAYLVASGNVSQDTQDFADEILRGMDIVPHAVVTLIRGEHSLKAEIRSIHDLKNL